MNLKKTFEVEISEAELAEAVINENLAYIKDQIADYFIKDEEGHLLYVGYYGDDERTADEIADYNPLETDEVELDLSVIISAELFEDDDYSEYRDLEVTIQFRLEFLLWDIMADSDTAPIVEVTIDFLEIETPFGTQEIDDTEDLEEALLKAFEGINVNPFIEEPRYLEY